MKSSKLITILETFSKEEMNRFGKFLDSPYFKKERDLKPLFSILKKLHPYFPEHKISVLELFKILYPARKFDKIKSSLIIRVLFSELTALAKKFTVYESFERGRNKYIFNECVAEWFYHRGLNKLAVQLHSINSLVLDKEEKLANYFDRRFRTNDNLRHLYTLLHKPHDQFKYTKNNLLYMYAYMFNNLASYLNNATPRITRDVPLRSFKLAESLVKAFQPALFESECEDDEFETKNITVYNYYFIKSLLDINDRDSLSKAIEYFYKLFPNVSQLIQFNCFVRLYNELNRRVHLEKFYAVELNELIDFTWNKGIFAGNKEDFLDSAGFRNALKIKSYLLSGLEVRKFIDTYVEKIAPKYREDIRDFSMAYLSFKERHFGKCLEYISRKNKLGPTFYITGCKLLIGSLYEEGHHEEALYASDSLEHYLRRNRKTIGAAVKKHFEFIKVFKYISKLESHSAPHTIMDLPKIPEMENHSIIGDWLMEKQMLLLKPDKPLQAS